MVSQIGSNFQFQVVSDTQHIWTPQPPPPTIIKGGGGKRTCTKGVQKFLLERGDKPEKGGLM